MADPCWSLVIDANNESFMNIINYTPKEIKTPTITNTTDSSSSPATNESDDLNVLKWTAEQPNLVIEIEKWIQLKQSDMSQVDDIYLLKYAYLVSAYLSKYMQMQSIYDRNKMLKYCEWLVTVYDYFMIKLDMPKYIQEYHRKDKQISSSSYRFCAHKSDCIHNYAVRPDSNGCFSDHYVYNKAKVDMLNICEYLKSLGDTIGYNKELQTCINTATFVVKNMFTELYQIYIYHDGKDSYKALHMNRKTVPRRMNHHSSDRHAETTTTTTSNGSIKASDGWHTAATDASSWTSRRGAGNTRGNHRGPRTDHTGTPSRFGKGDK